MSSLQCKVAELSRRATDTNNPTDCRRENQITITFQFCKRNFLVLRYLEHNPRFSNRNIEVETSTETVDKSTN